ncbi:hypothetical protein [Ponticaulis sp.]|uniref:hypothetical protein n=1 Tax=Ponticaulis sp. TaxID=2020902 RepID=UPI000B712295|nr:hypothetical protein [Ponticaulis sp.]MAI91911.1 hypothetical protein [Ponticaulis sp.]OUX96588.1 MAG: hypothetical protein CBB65_15885 [Hyphomonadaceae bacterium TMED5]
MTFLRLKAASVLLACTAFMAAPVANAESTPEDDAIYSLEMMGETCGIHFIDGSSINGSIHFGCGANSVDMTDIGGWSMNGANIDFFGITDSIDDLLKSGNCADGWEDIATGEAAYDEDALCWVNWENMVSVSRRQ